MLGNQGTIEQGTKCTSKEQVDQETHRGEYAKVERVSRVWDFRMIPDQTLKGIFRTLVRLRIRPQKLCQVKTYPSNLANHPSNVANHPSNLANHPSSQPSI